MCHSVLTEGIYFLMILSSKHIKKGTKQLYHKSWITYHYVTIDEIEIGCSFYHENIFRAWVESFFVPFQYSFVIIKLDVCCVVGRCAEVQVQAPNGIQEDRHNQSPRWIFCFKKNYTTSKCFSEQTRNYWFE